MSGSEGIGSGPVGPRWRSQRRWRSRFHRCWSRSPRLRSSCRRRLRPASRLKLVACGDRGAGGAAAALPLVGVGDRRRSRPGSCGSRERLSLLRCPGRSLVAPCSSAAPSPWRCGGGGGGASLGVGRGHTELRSSCRHRLRSAIGRRCRARIAEQVVRAALPLVGVGDRRRSRPGAFAGRERLSLLRCSGDRWWRACSSAAPSPSRSRRRWR